MYITITYCITRELNGKKKVKKKDIKYVYFHLSTFKNYKCSTDCKINLKYQ